MAHWRLVWALAAVTVCSGVISSQAPSGHAVFEQALAKERVEGNLQEAIRLYERVVAEFAADRALAATALVQVGLCCEKLGRDEAVRATNVSCATSPIRRMRLSRRAYGWPYSNDLLQVRRLPRHRLGDRLGVLRRLVARRPAHRVPAVQLAAPSWLRAARGHACW